MQNAGNEKREKGKFIPIFLLFISIISVSPQVNYTRWLCFCHVPAFCDSLPHFDTTLIFGRTFLKSVFQTMRKQLLDKFKERQQLSVRLVGLPNKLSTFFCQPFEIILRSRLKKLFCFWKKASNMFNINDPYFFWFSVCSLVCLSVSC